MSTNDFGRGIMKSKFKDGRGILTRPDATERAITPEMRNLHPKRKFFRSLNHTEPEHSR
jgi:hypothetical protein